MTPRPLCITITGTKGGTGKSLLARNLAFFFARLGKRTALLDFSRSFSATRSLRGVEGWLQTKEEGLYLQKVEGKGPLALSAPESPQLLRRFYEFAREEKKFDAIISDIPPSEVFDAIDLFWDAEIPLAVVTPEPESVFGTLELLSKLVFRLAEKESAGELSAEYLSQAANHKGQICDFPSPRDLLEVPGVPGVKEEFTRFLAKLLVERAVGLVVNGTRTSEEMEIGTEIEYFARRVLSLPLVYVGAIEHDEEAVRASKSSLPSILAKASCQSAQDVMKLGRRFIACPGLKLINPSLGLGIDGGESFYDILQVGFASHEYEIKRNYRKLTKMLRGPSMFCDHTRSKEALERLASECDRAFATLGDKGSRSSYDRILCASLWESQPQNGEEPAKEREQPMAAPRGRDARNFTGSLIKETRERMGLSFQDIASITKIGVPYLRAIEEENYVDLPEPVYLKGFLKEIARVLGLDPESVALSYLRRMKGGRGVK